MARPLASNQQEQEHVREAFIWMAEIFRINSRETGEPNPLKQEAVAVAIGITQGCLSRWLAGSTKTLQKGEAWPKLVKLLCDAREKLPPEGWQLKPYLYCDKEGVWHRLDFEAGGGDGVLAHKKDAACDYRCYYCHGLTPSKGMFCMHCGAVVMPGREILNEDGFLAPGDSWEIKIDDYHREPVGHKCVKTHVPVSMRFRRLNS